MNETDLTIVNFCRMLARVRKKFRETHIYAEKQPCFHSVSTTVSHSEKDIIKGNERLPAVEVSFSVDGGLKDVINGEKHSLGASVAIYYVQGNWRVEGELGWSCYEQGWDDYQSFEMIAENIDDLSERIESFVGKTVDCYRETIEKHL